MFGNACCGKAGGRHGMFGMNPMAKFMHQRGGGHCGGPGAVLRELNLTDEQAEKIAELKLQAMAQCAQLKLALGGTIKKVANELTQERIDKGKIKGIVEEMKAEKEKMSEAFVERIIAFAEVLTAEQRKKIRTLAIRKFLDLETFPHDEGEDE